MIMLVTSTIGEKLAKWRGTVPPHYLKMELTSKIQIKEKLVDCCISHL